MTVRPKKFVRKFANIDISIPVAARLPSAPAPLFDAPTRMLPQEAATFSSGAGGINRSPGSGSAVFWLEQFGIFDFCTLTPLFAIDNSYTGSNLVSQWFFNLNLSSSKDCNINRICCGVALVAALASILK